jgi:outer membrane protein assembly factor BamB
MDLSGDARAATSFKTAGPPIGAVALTTDGNVVAAIGRGAATGAAPGSSNAVVVLEPKTLQVKDWFSDSSIEFASQPVVFKHNEKDVIAVATTNGRIVLLDAAAPGGANHATPLAMSQPIAGARPDALATWQEMAPQTNAAGARWLLVPTANAINALKIVDDAGKPSIQPGWVSRSMPSASTPIVVNGVVFGVASGKPPAGRGAAAGTPAVLYALDGTSGKELWSSGKTITSFMPGRSLWSSNSQVYVGAYDGTVYAFGFLLERR